MQESPDRRIFQWIIDNADKIVHVNNCWLAFARENEATELTADTVLDEPLWRFIDGLETSYLYKQILGKVRSGKSPMKIPFRCDSPNCRRFMEMKLSLVPVDSIEFLSTILKLEYRKPVSLLDVTTERSEELLRICSWCKKIYLPHGQWVEIEEAIRFLDFFADAKLPKFTHTICEACHKLVVSEL